MEIVLAIVDWLACALIIYLAAWVFLTLRNDCRRRNAMNTTERFRCVIYSALVAFGFMAFLIGAVVL